MPWRPAKSECVPGWAVATNFVEEFDDIDDAARWLLRSVLGQFDSVPESGAFRDVSARCYVQIGDPSVAAPAHVELAIMHMNSSLDPSFAAVRFLAIRLRKSRDGGVASCTCCHGSKEELRRQLTAAVEQPGEIADRIEELAEGLEEESDPNLWR